MPTPALTQPASGRLPDGREVRQFQIEAGGLRLRAMEYGAAILSLEALGTHGQTLPLLLGLASLEDYLADRMCVGAMVGRVAGRIPSARFQLEGKTWELQKNDGPNHLHGGPAGFHRRLWNGRIEDDRAAISFHLSSPNGDGGHPGALEVEVSYELCEPTALRVVYEVSTDRLAAASLAQHSYFRLGGAHTGNALDCNLEIFADEFFPVDDDFAPLLEAQPVEGTPADFRKPKPLAQAVPRLHARHGDLYLLSRQPSEAPRLAARLSHPASGQLLEVLTTETCMQFYTGAALDSSIRLASGGACEPFAGLCFECQGHPAAIGRPGWEHMIARPGRPWRRETIYQFTIPKP